MSSLLSTPPPTVDPKLVRRERDRLRRPLEERAAALLVGSSQASVRLRNEVNRVATTSGTTVLLVGPAGSGKRLVAQAIHASSERRNGPIIHLASDADSDSELLNIFPDAIPPTAFGDANGGTLHLRNIETLSRANQERLASHLQEQQPTPSIKEGAAPPGGARLIASTARDLDQLSERGLFNEELCYRLNVLVVRVPALSERNTDTAAIAQAMLRPLRSMTGSAHLQLDEGCPEVIGARSWSGGWRELWNTLERAALLSPGPVIAPHLLGDSRATAATSSNGEVDRSLRAREEAWIRRVLLDESGNRSRTARVLGINRATLYNKLREYGIE